MCSKTRCYFDLSLLPTFEERIDYLKLDGTIGKETFGNKRWMNQKFYHSSEWRNIRDRVIVRDNGCDLGCEDHPIFGKIIIHHMVPISPNSLLTYDDPIFNPKYLICCSIATHNAIHYGDTDLVKSLPDRKPGDTIDW